MPTVLLVEDNSADVVLIHKALEVHRVECELLVLNDGESAIKFIGSLQEHLPDCPDLVIIDLNLPRRSGRDVLVCMREHPECGGARIVVLSSSNTPQDRDDTFALGASDFITKPTRLTDFLSLGLRFKEFLYPAQQ